MACGKKPHTDDAQERKRHQCGAPAADNDQAGIQVARLGKKQYQEDKGITQTDEDEDGLHFPMGRQVDAPIQAKGGGKNRRNEQQRENPVINGGVQTAKRRARHENGKHGAQKRHKIGKRKHRGTHGKPRALHEERELLEPAHDCPWQQCCITPVPGQTRPEENERRQGLPLAGKFLRNARTSVHQSPAGAQARPAGAGAPIPWGALPWSRPSGKRYFLRKRPSRFCHHTFSEGNQA